MATIMITLMIVIMTMIRIKTIIIIKATTITTEITVIMKLNEAGSEIQRAKTLVGAHPISPLGSNRHS